MSRFTESFLGEWLGYLGSWTVRLLSFGRWKPDAESWEAVGIGFVVLVAAVVCGKL